MRLINNNGGVPSLHMAFYKNLDLGADRVWDVWQLESPNTGLVFPRPPARSHLGQHPRLKRQKRLGAFD